MKQDIIMKHEWKGEITKGNQNVLNTIFDQQLQLNLGRKLKFPERIMETILQTYIIL